jgi:hypothetical protein
MRYRFIITVTSPIALRSLRNRFVIIAEAIVTQSPRNRRRSVTKVLRKRRIAARLFLDYKAIAPRFRFLLQSDCAPIATVIALRLRCANCAVIVLRLRCDCAAIDNRLRIHFAAIIGLLRCDCAAIEIRLKSDFGAIALRLQS